MKFHYHVPGGKLSVEFDAGTNKEAFKQLANLEEVFNESCCGKCKGDSIRFVVRHVEGNDFFELHCQNHKCRAKLAFGQHKTGGTLFPKRKGEGEEYLPDNGWVVWKPDNSAGTEGAKASAATKPKGK